MSIEDAYQAGTDKVLNDRVARPLPERMAPEGIDFQETVRQTLEFAANHYAILICVAAAVLAAVLARRKLSRVKLPRFTTVGKRAIWVIVAIGAVMLCTELLGPAGGASLGGVIVVTAFNRWRYRRD